MFQGGDRESDTESESSELEVSQGGCLQMVKSERAPRRYDFVLQEKGLENYIKSVGVLKSHTGYFQNKDVAYFVLRKIHKKKIRLDL